MNWGLTIKELIKQRRMTQKELADSAGLTRSHLSLIEAGSIQTHKPVHITKLARALSISKEELYRRILEPELRIIIP